MSLSTSAKILFLPSLLALACLGGCRAASSTSTANEDQITPSEELIVEPYPLIPDIPVPLGATFKTGESSNYQTGDRRVVNHHYRIWSDPLLVRLFYQENMPLRNWTLTNQMASYDKTTLSYRKANESCTVTIGPKNWFRQTIIHIEIQPIGN